MVKRIARRRSKAATTLVELVVAMALTALFAAACIMLVYPIEKIYTRSTDVARAQLVADTVADALRSECAEAYIAGRDDVWIGEVGNQIFTDEPTPGDTGHVLILRKNQSYCETIFANGEIPASVYNDFVADTELVNGNVTSRAIFDIFSNSNNPAIGSNYIHYGYYKAAGGTATPIIPSEYYDFTNPFSNATYREYTVELTFSEMGRDQNDMPAYVICKIDVKKGTELVYSRNTVLCFAAPVQQ